LFDNSISENCHYQVILTENLSQNQNSFGIENYTFVATFDGIEIAQCAVENSTAVYIVIGSVVFLVVRKPSVSPQWC